jgi:hypothetical protein
MKRRRFVAAVGASLALAGCSANDTSPETDNSVTPADVPSVGPSTTAPPPGATTVTPEDDLTPRELPQKRVEDAFTVGEHDGEINPMRLTIKSNLPGERTIRLRITDAQTDEQLLDETFTTAGEIDGKIRSPGDYEIRIGLREEGTESVETIDEGQFDTCNDYRTILTIGRDGHLSAETQTTLAACDLGPIHDAFTIGESVGEIEPLDVTLRNAGETEWTATLQITDRDSDESLHDDVYMITSPTGVRGEIRDPGNYEIRVSVDGESVVETIDEGLFDTCNGYGTTITIGQDGDLEAETITTQLACDVDGTVTDGGGNA